MFNLDKLTLLLSVIYSGEEKLEFGCHKNKIVWRRQRVSFRKNNTISTTTK